MTNDDITPGSPDDPLREFFSLSNTLKQWRQATGLSQDALARASGVSQKTINDLEMGHVSNPQDRTLRALAAAFSKASDVSEASLLKDLQAAKAYNPMQQASPFAMKLDNLMEGLPADWRVFMEDMLIEHYYAILRIRDHAMQARRLIKKKPR